ncbi:DUF2946 family protein [Reyranella sp.]|uniref:DUF2946 family protein n=1 Tax=Reyranella sp. TaxID=1929291 RepID=UPI003D1396E5
MPPITGPRLYALAAALFAITLNFLQPLVHAALMRDGAPQAMWSVVCSATAADPNGKQVPDQGPAQAHECCLGLAHVAPLAAPSPVFVVLPPIVSALSPSVPGEPSLSAGIRDGPPRPRGPPFFV